MREYDESPAQYAWIVYTVAALMFGGLAGYIIAVENGRAAPSAARHHRPSASGADAGRRRIRIARVPGNPRARSEKCRSCGQSWQPALRRRSATSRPSASISRPSRSTRTDINVSTDLGTALWYAGRADEALAQYERSLAINTTHAQTLFNVGIVRADGKHDYAGAAAAWEKLLQTNPDYPAVARVKTLIADARQKVAAF